MNDYGIQSGGDVDGEHYHLIQVILIKLIANIFQDLYGDWNFETNSETDMVEREANYFEFCNPDVLRNIRRDFENI